MTLPDFSGLRVHVIGDAIRDVYTQAKCLGMASKSPTLVYERIGESQEWEGGAWVVGKHCAAAGAEVRWSTAGATVKERIIVDGIKVAEFHTRVDDSETLKPWPFHSAADVVIFADFGHGVFRPDSLPMLLDVPRSGAVVAADSQTTDICWGNILDFAGCDLLFANEREARFALLDQQSPIEDIGAQLYAEAFNAGETTAIFLKRGASGLDIRSEQGLIKIPPYATQPIVDPIGAGDALLAYATLTYAVTKDLEQAGIIGSLAAAEACAHQGNEPVTRAAVAARLERIG